MSKLAKVNVWCNGCSRW